MWKGLTCDPAPISKQLSTQAAVFDRKGGRASLPQAQRLCERQLQLPVKEDGLHLKLPAGPGKVTVPSVDQGSNSMLHLWGGGRLLPFGLVLRVSCNSKLNLLDFHLHLQAKRTLDD